MSNNIHQKFIKNTIVLSLGLALAACGSDSDDPVVTPDPEVTNVAPVFTGSVLNTVEAGVAYSATVAGTDADGDTMSFSAASLPSWLTIDASSGALSGTPSADDVGEHAITLTVSDGTDSTTQSLTITVTAIPNVAPMISSTAMLTATVASPYSYTLMATDADQDTLTMSATTLPDWLSFDAATGILSGTPTVAGDSAVVLAVTDGTDSVEQTFTITSTAVVVVNAAPVINSTATLDATVGSAYSYTLVATDADQDSLTMSATTLPDWLSFDAATGILSGTPTVAGDSAVVLAVNDGTDSVEQTFTIAAVDATAALVIFEDVIQPQWTAWDCCGGSTAMLVTDNAEHAEATQFTINGDTVVGFSTRIDHGAVDGVPFDATSIETNGTFTFDLKMLTSPGSTDWKVKLESTAAATNAEVSLSASQEGHATPVLDTWQTYTFNISDLKDAGLDISAIDVVMMFPTWGQGNGAVYLIDNVKFMTTGAATTTPPVTPPTTTPPVDAMTLDFETAGAGAGFTWAVFENEDNPALEFVANPATTGINDSASVAMFTARQTGQPWAGTETAGQTATFTMDATNSIVKIMVYKSVISDVGIKFSIANGGAQPEIKVANTKINEWEELTFDFSSRVGLLETIGITSIIVFPDFNDARTSDNVVYFDNMTFSPIVTP